MTIVLNFILTAFAVAALTGVLLVVYESWKEGGFDKKNERRIITFSVVVGVVGALLAMGFWKYSISAALL